MPAEATITVRQDKIGGRGAHLLRSISADLSKEVVEDDLHTLGARLLEHVWTKWNAVHPFILSCTKAQEQHIAPPYLFGRDGRLQDVSRLPNVFFVFIIVKGQCRVHLAATAALASGNTTLLFWRETGKTKGSALVRKTRHLTGWRPKVASPYCRPRPMQTIREAAEQEARKRTEVQMASSPSAEAISGFAALPNVEAIASYIENTKQTESFLGATPEDKKEVKFACTLGDFVGWLFVKTRFVV
jgi:hypothetical protein